MRNEQEINEAIERYADTVRRLCMLHLKNHADTEDIFQTVFLKYALHTEPFADAEHEKAWLIRVTINACKDLLKSFFRSRTVSLDEVLEQPAALAPDHREVLEAVLSLPQKCGKYRAYLELHALDPSVTPADIQGMTMREIRDRIAALSGDGTVLTQNTNGSAGGGHHGNGAGNGKGKRHHAQGQ